MRNRLEKKLSYKLNITPGNEEAVLQSVAEWWDGFTWECGRHIVEWVSRQYGNIQVWAVGPAEGRGVIQHALQHMGVEETMGEYVYSESKNPRFGKVGTVRATIAAVRSGPDKAAIHTFLFGQFANVEEQEDTPG